MLRRLLDSKRSFGRKCPIGTFRASASRSSTISGSLMPPASASPGPTASFASARFPSSSALRGDATGRGGQARLECAARRYAGDKLCVNPFGPTNEPTLRQILCHRSGIMRESPVGGYFDPKSPTLPQTIDSLHGCPLVTAPNAKTRYSNIAPSLAGWIVGQTAGKPFEEFQRTRLLEPLAMRDSAWQLAAVRREKMIPYQMRRGGRPGWVSDASGPGLRPGNRSGGQPVFDRRKIWPVLPRCCWPKGEPEAGRFFRRRRCSKCSRRAHRSRYGIRAGIHGRQVPRA